VVLAAELLPAGSSPVPPSGSATAVSLSAAANVSAIFNDGSAVTNGGIDNGSTAYSETLLGTSLNFAGISFALLGPGVPDAVSGGTLTLPAGNFSKLNLLAAGVNGNQVNQPFTVTYTDGTATAITQSLSDWYSPQNYAGESKASAMAYRLVSTGATDNRTFYLYGYTFSINNAKTVKSITLPNNRNVVVLAAELIP